MFFLILGVIMFAIALIIGIMKQRAVAFGFVSLDILFLVMGGLALSGTFTG